MATAKKLPSGSWRIRVYSHSEELTLSDGSVKEKKIYKSFTCDDPSLKGKRKCEAEAAAWAISKESFVKIPVISFGEAADKYIESHGNILSPTTLTAYSSIRKQNMQSIMNIRLDELTQEDIQKAVNLEALTHSPKTVRNMHCFISAVLKTYRPEFQLHTALPKRQKTELYLPTESEIKRLLSSISGTVMELPVLLAIFGPMRRGEICALEDKDISGSIVHVSKNMVINKERNWVIKTPKSYAGDRYIIYPDFVAEKWKGKKGRIVELTPDMITDRFHHCLSRAGIPKFRFHDLRHFSASVLHAAGMQDAYIMQRGGWSSDGVLKSIYRHALSEETIKENDAVNLHFSKTYDTKYDTK